MASRRFKDTNRNRITSLPPTPSMILPVQRVISDAIADRAYQYYLERGRTHGGDLADWLRAERELAGNGDGEVAEIVDATDPHPG